MELNNLTHENVLNLRDSNLVYYLLNADINIWFETNHRNG